MFTQLLGSIRIVSGRRRKSKTRYPKCRICDIMIKELDYTVTIHKVGETHAEIHKDCAGQLIHALQSAIKEREVVDDDKNKV